MAGAQNRGIAAAAGDVDAERGHRTRRPRAPAALCRRDPGGGHHLPGVVLLGGGEVTVQQHRAQRLRQRLQGGHVVGRHQVRVVGDRGRDECPAARPDQLALVRERPAVRHFGVGAVERREPPELARPGRVGVLTVQPWRPVADHPFALGRRRRVAGTYDAQPLPGVGGAVPADQETELGLEKMGDLVEGLEVVRPALELVLVARVLAGAELDPAAVGQAPGAVLGVVLAALADDLACPVDDRLQLLVLAAEDDGAPVPGQRQADQQVGLAAAGLAAVQKHVGGAVIGLGLRPGNRLPDPRRRRQQAVDLGALLRLEV